MTYFGGADQRSNGTFSDGKGALPHKGPGGLLERERELEVLATMDVGSFVVIEGDAGIGKTRLLRAAREQADDRGVRVLGGHGSELARQFPFGLVRRLLEPARPVFADTAAGARHVFDPSRPASGELATLHGLGQLIGHPAREPTVLLLDDLHWADAASLRFLAYLRPRLGDLAVSIVAAVGTGRDADDNRLLSDVVGHPDVHRVRPRPLTAAAVADLLGHPLDGPAEPEFVAACAQATAGHPFLVHALVRALRRAGLKPVRDSVAAVRALGSELVPALDGLDGLGEAARGVAEALAVLGPDTPLATLAAMVDADRASTSDSLDELTGLGLVRLDDGVSFGHPIIGAAAYDGLSGRVRARAHARAADVLAAEGLEPEQVAAHVLKTPPGLDPQAGPRLRRAAEEADRRGSPDAALALLDRCLREELPADERLTLLRQAGELALRVDRDAAVRLLAEAHHVAPDDAAIAARLGAAYGFRRDPDRAFESFTAALAAVPLSDEDGRRRLAATLLVGAVTVPGRRSVTDRLSELTALSTHNSVGGRMLSAAVAVYGLAAGSPDAVDRAHSALADGVLVREVNGDGAVVCGWLTLLAGDDPFALRSLEDAVARAHGRGSLRDLAVATTLRCLGRLWTGQLAGAEADGWPALRTALADQVELDPSFAGGHLADALTAQGRLDEAERVLESVGVPAPRSSDRPRSWGLDAFARLRRHQGRHAEAVAAALDAGRDWAEFGFTNPAVGGWRAEAALGLFGLGDPAGARHWAEEELNLARRFGAPRALGRALRVSGQLAGGPDGLARLTESAEVLERSPARLEYATTLVELGAALRRSGRLADARAVLAAALDQAERCGAGPLAGQARTELRTADNRPRRDHLTGPGSQTPTERLLTRLAANSAPDREITEALFGG